MSWSTPRTWVVGEVVTAAILNAHVRDNLNLLVPQAATVLTSETTTSTTYADLTTPGPSVTVTCAQASVIILYQGQNGTISIDAFASYELSGDNTLAASDQNGARFRCNVAGKGRRFASVSQRQGLAQSTGTTFKMKYRVVSGTGTFLRRTIIVLPTGPDR